MSTPRGTVADHEATALALGDPTHMQRVLPDYTWPWRLPLDALRRLIERESADAIRLTNSNYLTTP